MAQAIAKPQPPGPPLRDTGAIFLCQATEKELLAQLVKHHGWAFTAPRTLFRWKR